jgi:hypothetical protein
MRQNRIHYAVTTPAGYTIGIFDSHVEAAIYKDAHFGNEYLVTKKYPTTYLCWSNVPDEYDDTTTEKEFSRAVWYAKESAMR